MSPSRRGLLLLVLSLPVLVVLTALIYMVGMHHLEGETRDFWRSLSWAAETLTTTGYGVDGVWRHPAMVVFVVVSQFIGVFLVFLIFPLYLIPFLEERFEARLPRQAPELSDHVLIYRSGPAVSTLLAELDQEDIPSLVIEEDEAEARRLFDRGRPVLYRGLDDGAFQAAGLLAARVLIANGTDDQNAAAVLAARQAGFAGDILVLVEEPMHRKPMMLAGATAVYTPRHVLGAALAARASRRIGPRVSGLEHLGRQLQVTDVRIHPHSPLAGRTLEEAAIGARTGVTVIGQWVAGKLTSPPTPETEIAPGGILIVVGGEDNIRRFTDLAAGAVALRARGPFVVGGYGEVGRKVAQLLRDAGEEVCVIDRRPSEGVNLAGNMLDVELLREAGVERAQAVIVALDVDSATLFATVIVKDVAPEVPVIARVNQMQNVERIHRAGADFALSISQVSGQILARRLLGEEAVSVNPQLKVRRVPTGALAGKHPATLGIREKTGCSVVAVERGDEVLVDFGPEFRFAAGDAVYICGSNQAVRRFGEVFG